MSRKVTFHTEGLEDYSYWAFHDRKIFKKVNNLLKDIERNGNEGLGKPEPLKGDLSGYWSRRIDDTNRLVYYFDDDFIYIVTCKGHYKKD